MKAGYNQFNPKRRLAEVDEGMAFRLKELAKQVKYGGNPEHKKNPGDFGLTPPSDPRQGKSLCDISDIFTHREALKLLQAGIRKGLVSHKSNQGWPQNVWAVTKDGCALEAQLENCMQGSYHGYPMPDSDPLKAEILSRWGAHG